MSCVEKMGYFLSRIPRNLGGETLQVKFINKIKEFYQNYQYRIFEKKAKKDIKDIPDGQGNILILLPRICKLARNAGNVVSFMRAYKGTINVIGETRDKNKKFKDLVTALDFMTGGNLSLIRKSKMLEKIWIKECLPFHLDLDEKIKIFKKIIIEDEKGRTKDMMPVLKTWATITKDSHLRKVIEEEVQKFEEKS